MSRLFPKRINILAISAFLGSKEVRHAALVACLFPKVVRRFTGVALFAFLLSQEVGHAALVACFFPKVVRRFTGVALFAFLLSQEVGHAALVASLFPKVVRRFTGVALFTFLLSQIVSHAARVALLYPKLVGTFACLSRFAFQLSQKVGHAAFVALLFPKLIGRFAILPEPLVERYCYVKLFSFHVLRCLIVYYFNTCVHFARGDVIESIREGGIIDARPETCKEGALGESGVVEAYDHLPIIHLQSRGERFAELSPDDDTPRPRRVKLKLQIALRWIDGVAHSVRNVDAKLCIRLLLQILSVHTSYNR